MLIHIGNKRVERRQGYIADFCPMCRELRKFELIRISHATAFYGVPLGQGKLLTFTIRCERCGVWMPVGENRYTDLKADRDADLDRLAARTFPSLRQLYAERLELERMILRQAGSLPGGIRMQLMIEPFKSVAWMVEDAYAGQVPLDAPSGIGCLLALGIPGGLFFTGCLVKSLSMQARDWLLLASVISFLVLAAYALVQFGLRPRRYLRRRITPLLALALRPLAPSREELESCLQEMQKEAPSLTANLSPEELLAAIQQPSRVR